MYKLASIPLSFLSSPLNSSVEKQARITKACLPVYRAGFPCGAQILNHANETRASGIAKEIVTSRLKFWGRGNKWSGIAVTEHEGCHSRWTGETWR